MSDREANGRFAKGNRVSPGRHARPTERRYLEMLLGELTPERWIGIVRRAIADALQGSGEARRWLAEYAVGRPPQIIELKAAEAAQLAELLRLMESQGHSASDVFAAMLQEIALTSDDDNATQ